jgi:hypothetical protein
VISFHPSPLRLHGFQTQCEKVFPPRQVMSVCKASPEQFFQPLGAQVAAARDGNIHVRVQNVGGGRIDVLKNEKKKISDSTLIFYVICPEKRERKKTKKLTTF